MKWIVYLLLVANLTFFFWQYQRQERAAARQDEAQEPAYVSRLLLLSEVPPERLAARSEPGPAPQAAAAEGPVAEASAAAEGDGAGPGATPSQAAPPAPAPEPEAAGANGAGPTGPAPSPSRGPEGPAPAETGVPTGVVEPATPEAAPSPSRAPAAVAAEASGEPAAPAGESGSAERGPAPAPDGRCYALGPFAEEAPAAAVRAWLGQRGASSDLRWATRQEPRSFWVYLPPVGSAEQARELTARLGEAGVKDVMRLPAGPRANAVSLGLYVRRPDAERRAAEIRRLGYEPAIEARHRDVREAWVDVRYAAGEELPVAALRGAFPGTPVTPVECR